MCWEIHTLTVFTNFDEKVNAEVWAVCMYSPATAKLLNEHTTLPIPRLSWHFLASLSSRHTASLHRNIGNKLNEWISQNIPLKIILYPMLESPFHSFQVSFLDAMKAWLSFSATKVNQKKVVAMYITNDYIVLIKYYSCISCIYTE